MKYDLCIIGGAGHVGLPFGAVAASRGVKTVLLDINREALRTIEKGIFPFAEEGGEAVLRAALKKKCLFTTTDPKAVKDSTMVLLITGTPVDEYLNPEFHAITRVMDQYLPYFHDGQILILRSTVYPGTSEKIQRLFQTKKKKVHVTFCPERVAQGVAIREITDLPQIISGFDEKTINTVEAFFKKITKKRVIRLQPVEAELAKLFSNAWRYIRFAAANQFFMIAEEHKLNYKAIYDAMREDYPRNKDLPAPGFAAGPCLLKDTLQLAAFHNNNFSLGHAAMLINEGLPNFLVRRLKLLSAENLKEQTVGLLGMAFKSDSDDPRDSLSYKLKKIAQNEAKRVLAHDPFIKDPTFSSLETTLSESDILILATPHTVYKKINPKDHPGKVFIDIWNFWET